MARKRMIDPAWLESESLGNCCRDARLLFFGLISLADDEGRLRGNAQYLKSAVFPYDQDVTTDSVNSWLSQLEKEGSISKYEMDGKNYIVLLNFLEYQNISKPTPSRLPEPPPNNINSSQNFPGNPRESQNFPEIPQISPPNRIEEKGREEKRKEEEKKSPGNFSFAPEIPKKPDLPEKNVSGDLGAYYWFNENVGEHPAGYANEISMTTGAGVTENERAAILMLSMSVKEPFDFWRLKYSIDQTFVKKGCNRGPYLKKVFENSRETQRAAFEEWERKQKGEREAAESSARLKAKEDKIQAQIREIETAVCGTCGGTGRQQFTQEQIEAMRESGQTLLPELGRDYPCEECGERRRKINALKLEIQPAGAV